jgi:hypothetical protein
MLLISPGEEFPFAVADVNDFHAPQSHPIEDAEHFDRCRSQALKLTADTLRRILEIAAISEAAERQRFEGAQ